MKQLLGSHGQSLEQLKQMSDELQRDEKSCSLFLLFFALADGQ